MMNKNSNTYIIIYATVMVVVVALVLAFTAMLLKPRQQANAENEMKGAILQSIGEGEDAASASDKTAYINEQYERYIKESFGVDLDGNIIEGSNAFELLLNLKSQYDKPASERVLPVFIGESDSGTRRYIFPVRGAGLWGPIWGYIALESDLNTIYGVVFDHQGETPGLGAEIATPAFENQFQGKAIFSGDRLVAISVLKGSGSSAGNDHAVDAISGGTITSKAVESMLMNCLGNYENYIAQERSGQRPAVVADPDPSTAHGDQDLEFTEIDSEKSPFHDLQR